MGPPAKVDAPCRFEACHPHHHHNHHALYIGCVVHLGIPLEWTMAKKQSGRSASSLAEKVLAGAKPKPKQGGSLAGSVLFQDEKKGQAKPPKKK